MDCMHRTRVIAWRSYRACFWRWPKNFSLLLHGFVDPQSLKIPDAQRECVGTQIQCQIEAHIYIQQDWGCLEVVVIAIKEAVFIVDRGFNLDSILNSASKMMYQLNVVAHNVFWMRVWSGQMWDYNSRM